MITSTSNPQIRQIVQLNTKARARRREGLFAAEGIKLFHEAPQALREKVFVSESFLADADHRQMVDGTPYETVSDSVFAHMSDTATPQGILTLLHMPHYGKEELLGSSGRPALIMVLEDLQDPGNMGTILRTGEGAGVTGVVLSKGCVDLFAPKTIRSTMGSVFRVPFYQTDDLAGTIAWLKQEGIQTCAAHLKGELPYHKADYLGGTAFLIGNEGNGLTEETAALADVKVKIPMEGKVESLNAAVAAALLMYEAHNRRAEKTFEKE